MKDNKVTPCNMLSYILETAQVLDTASIIIYHQQREHFTCTSKDLNIYYLYGRETY
jgi:hypothetical protein